MPSREELLAREARWSLPVALGTLAAIGLLIAAGIVVRAVGGDGDAEILRSAHEHGSAITLSSVLQALAFALLAMPLVYLFRAVGGRSEKVRGQLIGLIVAAPLFLAAASLFNATATNEAASQFVDGKASSDLTVKEAREECSSDREDGEALSTCAATKVADDRAQNAVSDAPTRNLATGLALGGRLGLAFALVYCCLYGMRTGLLTRFWGSLGMALGAGVLLLLIQFTLIWFLYFALLVAGWVPGGRPPAWAAGEAVPWPTPGEKAAAELEGESAASIESAADAEPESGERRKRKRRD